MKNISVSKIAMILLSGLCKVSKIGTILLFGLCKDMHLKLGCIKKEAN